MQMNPRDQTCERKRASVDFRKEKIYLENYLKLNVGLNVHVNGENKLN